MAATIENGVLLALAAIARKLGRRVKRGDAGHFIGIDDVFANYMDRRWALEPVLAHAENARMAHFRYTDVWRADPRDRRFRYFVCSRVHEGCLLQRGVDLLVDSGVLRPDEAGDYCPAYNGRHTAAWRANAAAMNRPATPTRQEMLDRLGLRRLPDDVVEVKRAARALFPRIHPDAGGDEETFRAAYESYKSLCALYRGGSRSSASL